MSQSAIQRRPLGVTFSTDKQATIGVWAPVAKAVTISINDHAPLLPLENDGSGYWQLTTSQLKPGDQYTFLVDDRTEQADPASRLQPQGAHGPSQAFDSNVAYWEDSSWINPPIDEYIIYEIDIHAFTPEGTFSAVIDKLSHLRELGTNAVLIRPVTPFAGASDQGTETNFLFAVQDSYGGPDQLQHLINACHYEGLAVILDLPYEQLDWTNALPGGELSESAYRQYRIQNALMWFRDFHVDALFLNGIYRLPNAEPLLRAIREQTSVLTAQTGRQHYLLTERDLTLVSRSANSFKHRVSVGEGELATQTNFDRIQHQPTSARNDCLCDSTFSAILRDLFARETDSASDNRFVELLQTYQSTVTTQSDQQIDRELLKLLAGAILVSPCIPTLFMGEEWGVTSPLRRLRHDEPIIAGTEPDRIDPPADSESLPVLPWEALDEYQNRPLYRYYQSLTALRRQLPALYHLNPNQVSIVHQPGAHTLLLHRWYKTDHVLCLLNFCADKQPVLLPALGNTLHKQLDSADPVWDGPGASPESLSDTSQLLLQPKSIVVYTTRT